MKESDKNEIKYIRSSDTLLIRIEDDISALKKKKDQSKPYYEYKLKRDINFENKPVKKEVYKNRRNAQTYVIQIVKYKDTGIISHIHCKKCDSEWKENTQRPLNGMFTENSEFFECKNCGEKFYKT